MAEHLDLGKKGEEIAFNYLIKAGFKVLYKNRKEGHDEIDIIALHKDGTLIFYEIKTLLGNIDSSRSLMPEDNATRLKLHRIGRACQIFAAKHPELIDEDRGWRLDLIAIVIGADGKLKRLSHYENV